MEQRKMKTNTGEIATPENEILLKERFRNIEEIVLLTLNRPKSRNALNRELVKTLHEAVREVNKNRKIRCVVITGSPPVLVASTFSV